MIPTGYRMLYHLRERGVGVWVSIEEIYEAFPRTQIRRAAREAREIGFVEEAAYVLTDSREPGWMHELALSLAPDLLDKWDAYVWLGAVRLTEDGARQLSIAWANGWRPPVDSSHPTRPSTAIGANPNGENN